MRIGGAQLDDVGGVEALVHLAAALPGDDLDGGLARDVAGQELVRQQNDAVHTPFGRDMLDHLHRVGAGAADVDLGLHLGGGVDVGDHRHAGIALLDQPYIGAGDRGGQRTAGAQVGDQHGLVGADHFRGLGHEQDAGLDDDRGVGLGRLAGQTKAVADIVADAVEDLRRHIVVRQDDGVLLALQRVDRGDQRRLQPPFQRGDARLDLLPDRAGCGLNLAGERQRHGSVRHNSPLLFCSL